MSLPNLTLQTDKNNTSIDTDRITIRQSESGLVLTADLITANGGAYDLTDCLVLFGENKDGDKMVSDDDVGIIDKKGGRIQYLLNTAVYQASGDAWFEITDNANKLIDTTTNFHIEVVPQANLPVDNENYWSRAEGMLTHVQAFMRKVQNDVNAAVDEDKTQVTDFIKTFQQTLDTYKAELATYDDKYNKLSSEWASTLADIQSSATKAINDAVQKFDDENKSIQADANATIDQINADKQATITQANSDFKSKLDSIQSDYNSWKTTTIADFQKQLDQLKQELKDDEDAQSSIRDAIKAANNAISKINDVDFTQYVKKDDFNAALAKINTLGNPTEVDNKTNPDSLTEPGFYFSKNGLNFDKSKIPDGYRSDGKTYVAVLEGDNPDNSINYYQQFMFQATKFSYECWYRAGYQYGTNAYYTVSFTNLKDINGPLKQISVNGGKAVGPDDKGIANITVPAPDLSPLEEEINKRPLTVNNIAPDSKGNVAVPIPDVSGIKNDIQNMQNQITSNALSAMKSWTGTLSQYQALTSYDPMTMYFIISDYEVVIK